MQHVQSMLAEREVTAELMNDAHPSTKLVFTTEDKLGSHWPFLPMLPNERTRKITAEKWRYRQCLQGNAFPGVGSFLSVVSPMLHTGSNCGCSALLLYISTDRARKA
eukprot:324839-Pleurochrysis_carterae.AAC.2